MPGSGEERLSSTGEALLSIPSGEVGAQVRLARLTIAQASSTSAVRLTPLSRVRSA